MKSLTERPKKPKKRTPSPEDLAIAERLKEARKAAGYRTATEFSDKNGIPQSTYANYEICNRFPRWIEAADLAKKLNIRLEWLVTGEGPTTDEWASLSRDESLAVMAYRKLDEFQRDTLWHGALGPMSGITRVAPHEGEEGA